MSIKALQQAPHPWDPCLPSHLESPPPTWQHLWGPGRQILLQIQMPLGTEELWPQFPFVPVWFIVQLTLTGYAEARILWNFWRKFPHIFHFFSSQRQFAGRVMATFLGSQMRNKASGRGENSAYVASTDAWHIFFFCIILYFILFFFKFKKIYLYLLFTCYRHEYL